MAGVMYLLSVLGTVLGTLLLIICIGCGLLYISEWVEEHPRLAKRVIQSLSLIIVVFHVALTIFDRLPLLQTFVSLICHGVYNLNARTFPFIRLYSFPFIGSCVAIGLHHFMWFFYFMDNHYQFTFSEVVSFMGLCVWTVPFSYFVSISTTETFLPESDKSAPNQKRRENLFQSLVRGIFGRSGQGNSNGIYQNEFMDNGNNGDMGATNISSGNGSSVMIPRSTWNRKLE